MVLETVSWLQRFITENAMYFHDHPEGTVQLFVNNPFYIAWLNVYWLNTDRVYRVR